MIDGFIEITNIVYIAKKLHDMGRYELVRESFFDTLCFDVYYDNMYSLLQNLYGYFDTKCDENRGFDYHILSDKVIEDYYTLAGEYGKRNGIPDDDNPYINAAEEEAYDKLNFSYCVDWKFMVHTEPKRPFHSRLALFLSHDCYVDLGVLAYQLIELYEWFSSKCDELRQILAEDPNQIKLEEVLAA